MQLGWIDFSKEDRQKALDVINLLSEQGAVDELGIGIIRDAFANYFFPGTSTVQTRAKYFLIVPYVLREAVDGKYGKDANRVLRAIDSAEKDCGIRLLEADPKAEGVIGTRVLPKGWVARKPSDIYWNGIRTFERVDYLFRHNQNRVLVADEVGMGKTLIARGAIVKTARLKIEAGIKEKRSKANIVEGILQEDVLFSSPSGAAMFVVGKSANGLTSWKNADGITLKDIESDETK